MGIHNKNRQGKKMIDVTMQKKGNKVTNVGFRLELCGPKDRAFAFEVNPLNNNIEDHTIAVTSSSDKFANYSRGVIRGGSVGCGHLNQFLAAVRDGAESCYPELCNHGDNRLSKDIVAKDNAAYADAIDNGITWYMFKYQLEVDYPEFPAILQRALNVEHHVGEGKLSNISI